MRVEQFKLLSAARALGSFTKVELAERTGAKREAVNSFFKRHARHFFERTGEKRRSGGVGASAEIWRIAEAKRSEIDGLLDTTRSEVGRELIDPKAAEEAISDDHTRWQMRVNLFQVRGHLPGATRDVHLNLATQWLNHEKRRLRHWGAAIEVPKPISLEVAKLSRQLEAARACVDLLETVPELTSLEGAWRWINVAAVRYAEQPTSEAFAPLKLSEGSTNEIAKELAEAIKMSPLMSSIPSERLIVATLATLPGLEADARLLICDVLDALGGDTVGNALFHEFDEARWQPSHELRELAILVLMALDNYPELLSHNRYERVRHWFEGLPSRYIWHNSFAPYWDKAARYTNASPQRVKEQMAPCTDAVREANDPQGWLFSGILAANGRVAEEARRVADAFLHPMARRDNDWLAEGYGAR